MATKKFDIPNIGEVAFVKRQASKNIRLSYTNKGELRVSLPLFATYKMGISFVLQNVDWINQHRPTANLLLQDGDRIGKAHRIFVSKSPSASRPSTRVTATKINLTMPTGQAITDNVIQVCLEKAAHKALHKEASILLPQRLASLAQEFNFSYQSVDVKRLTSRWGSCNQLQQITLNTYLMQTPWHLIDYVILHELTHTEHMDHSASFWQKLESTRPNARALRKELKQYKTAITTVNPT
ncbi:DUF45 domain-containing protein [Candidatus Saccharibacteria bacterium]|nr:DUF45 domain-containing protein [Candidatus Saccharibacteria bacterium]